MISKGIITNKGWVKKYSKGVKKLVRRFSIYHQNHSPLIWGVILEMKYPWNLTVLSLIGLNCFENILSLIDPYSLTCRYFRRLWSWDLSAEQLNSMERIARENSQDILRILIINGSDLNAKDNTGATVLYRASTVENFQDVIKFLLEVGCRVTQNNLSWIRVKNPDLTELVESELQNPRSLMRQSRLALWKCLRNSSSKQKFYSKLESLGENNGLPFVLIDYLNCR